jgi:hypothetical protein
LASDGFSHSASSRVEGGRAEKFREAKPGMVRL